jgi:hypothetical protein
MRLSHFFGLVGLANLVGASPTPIEASQLPTPQLLLFAESHFKGVAYEIKAQKTCVKLPPPVYENLHSLQLIGQRCWIMKDDDCSGEALMIAAGGMSRWSYIEMDEMNDRDFAHSSAAIICRKLPVWKKRDVATPEKRDEEPERHLVVFAEEGFQGAYLELEATNRCVKLDPPVYKNLHSYGVNNQNCYFMDTDRCNGKVLIRASAQGAEVWQSFDNGFSSHVTSVYCGDLTLLQPINTATSPAKPNPLGPGQMILYENADGSGRNETLLADGVCVKVPNTVAHKVRKIIQVSGRNCRYYDTSCGENPPVYKIDSHNTPVIQKLDAWYGDRIGFVMCKVKWSTTSDAAPVESRNNEVAFAGVGDVHACKYNRKRESCQDLNALGSCKAFNDNLSKQIDTLRQGGGSECKYWRNKDCSGLTLTSISGANDYSPNLGPGNRDGKEMSAVSCQHQSPSAMVEVGTTIHSDEGYTTHASPLKREAGQVLVADQIFLGGNTLLVKTTDEYNNCAPLSKQFHWHLASLRQYQGSVCTYWQDNCGENIPLFTIDSRSGDRLLNELPNSFGPDRNKVGYIRCMNGQVADEFMTHIDSSDPKVVRPATTTTTTTTSISPRSMATNLSTREKPHWAHTYTPLLVCHNVNLGGSCYFYQGPGCAQNPFGVDAIESLKMDKGYRCAFYNSVDCQPTKGPPHYIDSKTEDKVVQDVEFEIWSIKCTPFS